ncbi:MAG TPA: ABC transporter ATP-binding protein [Lachnospiraceae bacterium]|nr:ABC transporter ATP-binding protein [Lachnospiraceae bacterium]
MATDTTNTTKQKEKPPKPRYNMWQSSWYMIRLAIREKEKKVLILCTLTALLAVASNLANLSITPVILGAVENHSPLSTLLLLIGGFVALTMLLSAAASYVSTNILYGKITVRTAIITKLNTKMAATSYPNISDEKFLKMRGKASDSISCNSAAAEAVWDTLTRLLENVLGFLIYLALLSSVNPLLILVITATSLLGYFINKPLSEYGYRHREEEGLLTGTLFYYSSCAESSHMAKDIRLFGMRPWLEELYAKTWSAYQMFQRKAQNVYIWGRIADLVLAFLRNGFVYAYLIYLMLNGNMSVSLFLLYFTAAGNFSGWVSGILGTLLTLYQQGLEISNVRECLEYPEPFLFKEGAPLEPDIHRPYEIRLEDVSFRYPNTEKDTLSHISLTLHPGEKLAVVGLNGAGKTTLIKLLCGFLDPTEGRVLLDGRDIREYNRRDYYRLFAAVFQDFSVLATTIAANVAQREEDIDMPLVKDCIAKAGLTEKIESLPEQYEEKLCRDVYEDAVMLSGGETQRLMLARALYKKAPFVMLDEPTAALDPIAEADLYSKYHEMTAGRSSVYISHRLASTRFCDRIILIENGIIAEEGTHEGLLAKNGRYAELFEVQSKYYKKDSTNGANENSADSTNEPPNENDAFHEDNILPETKALPKSKTLPDTNALPERKEDTAE